MSDKEITIRGKQIVYTGAEELLQYVVKTINHCSLNKEQQTGVFVDITLGRPLTSNMMTVFLPTFMLLIISQMSTLFSSNYLDLVIEVNVTVLLVLTTLFMGISSTLPSTGYIKMIDIWMLFTMTYPFFIIIIHSVKEVISTRIVDTMHLQYSLVFLGV